VGLARDFPLRGISDDFTNFDARRPTSDGVNACFSLRFAVITQYIAVFPKIFAIFAAKIEH
jgi:hypothetical protein